MAGTAGEVEQKKTGTKILYLEAVRGAASIVVLLQHIVAAEYPAFEEWSRHVVDLGRVGVVAFFVVSGYVITLSLAHQSARTFVVRRFFRLFPMYWLVLAAMLLIGILSPASRSADPTLLVLMVNVLMLQGITPLASIVPTAWTLGIELLFYAQAFVARLLGWLRGSVALGYVWLAGYLGLSVVGGVLDRDLPTTPAALLYTAAFGQALYLRDHGGSRAWLPLVVSGLVVIPAGAFLSGDSDAQWPPMTYAVSYLAGMAMFAVFYLFRDRISGRGIVWLGAISYAVYLTHPLVYRLVGLVTEDPFLVSTLTILLTVGLSELLHRFVEKPFIAVGRRLTSSRSEAPRPPVAPSDGTGPIPSAPASRGA